MMKKIKNTVLSLVEIDDAFWSLVDDYEANRISKKVLYKKLLKLNNGDEIEAKADFNLAITKEGK